MSRRFLGLAIAASLTAFAISSPQRGLAQARQDEPAAAGQRREKRNFTDAQIVDGFLKTSFGAEFHLAGRIDRIRKFEKPVRVFIDNKGRPDRRNQLAGIIADIGARIQYLDIAVTDDRDLANVIATLVRDRDFYRTLAAMFGAERTREIRRSLDPQCLSGFTKNDRFQIEHAEVVLTVDVGDFTFRDCAYEEFLQALGPINDTSSVPWTMFNDRVQFGYFDVYDQYLLNILYDPRIKAGMTAPEVNAVLPDVLASVRAHVGAINGLAQ